MNGPRRTQVNCQNSKNDNAGWQIQDGFKSLNTTVTNSDKTALYASLSVIFLLIILAGVIVAIVVV